jgi:protein TonB
MRAARGVGAAAAIGMHAVALAALLSYAPSRHALLAAAPIMVELILPARVEQPKPQPAAQPPKPLPVARRAPPKVEPLPVLAAPAEAPSPYVAPAAPPPIPAPPLAAAPPVVPFFAPKFDADYLHNPAPVYPRLARKLGEQGRVILRVLVTAGGTADEVQIQTTSGHARLDDAARDTVRAWKFLPARRGDRAVAAWVLIPISFRLEG